MQHAPAVPTGVAGWTGWKHGEWTSPAPVFNVFFGQKQM